MPFDYANLRDETAEPLITEFGKQGALLVGIIGNILVDRDGNPILDRDGNYIIVDGGVPWGSQLSYAVSYPVTLVQIGFTKSDNNGTLVEKGDVLFLVSTEGLTIDPALANRFIANGITYQVIRIDPLYPGPIIMKWNIHGRK
jgi:hypothetical protein